MNPSFPSPHLHLSWPGAHTLTKPASFARRGGFLLMLLIGGVIRASAAEALIPVTPGMLSGPLVFFATPAGVEFAEPVPYGFENNLADRGWIWPNDNTGLLAVDFGVPIALTRFRVYCVYNGGERGANWAIERSEDNTAWVQVADFPYRQGQGIGLDDSGNPVDGYGGWYQAVFNNEATAARYWRIRQTEVLASHAPRSGQVEFYGIAGESPQPTLKSTSPTGNTVRKNAVITVELEDGAVTQLAPSSIQLTLNGQLVTPTINKPAGSKVTTITYAPQGTLPEGANSVHLVFGDTATPPVVQTADFSFVVINDASASLVINLDFNGVRNDPGPDLPGPTFDGQGAGGGGGVWNGLNADSRTQIGLDDNDNLTVTGTGLLNSIGDATGVNFTISPVGGDVAGTATLDPQSPLALFSDQIFVGFGAQITLSADFTISGLGTIPYADLYFYTSIGAIEVAGGEEQPVLPSVLFKSSNTRFFHHVPVANGEIKGKFTGDPGRLSGLSIARAAPQPFVKSAGPTGGDIRRNAVVKVELQDYVTQVAPASIQLLFNGQLVQPTLDKPAGSDVTTITYDPPGPIAEGPNSFRIVFSDTASPPVVQTHDYGFFAIADTKILVTPSMLSGPLAFFASPEGLTFKSPIPYGIANNVDDVGWIWPQDNSGLLHVDFGAPTAVARFRVFVTFPGSARGAVWAIEGSNDDANWVPIKDFTYETKAGGVVNDDGTKRTDFGGWYETTFNETGAASYRYWQIRQTSVTIGHAPRSGQVEFYGVLPEPSVVSAGPTGANVRRDAALVVELRDNQTAVNASSIQLLLNGQAVT
ncbi:MAG: hypothetical protein L0Z50_33540, partial [Verrucomicrobiales bacterium]|nr:hypothetical protein [Verrucomicrobiales bacterium]